MTSATAIIVAAGRGTRFGASDKVLQPLDGRPLLSFCVDAFEAATSIDGIVVVAGAHTIAMIEQLIAHASWTKVRTVVPGGERRQDSVAAGLDAVSSGSELVVVHDAARPFVTVELIDNCVDEARRSGAAIAAVPVTDTLKLADDGVVVRTVPRAGMWAAQTPQAARTVLLREAFAHAGEGEIEMTDEAGLLEACGIPVTIVPGSLRNLKVTSADDLLIAEAIIHATATTGQP